MHGHRAPCAHRDTGHRRRQCTFRHPTARSWSSPGRAQPNVSRAGHTVSRVGASKGIWPSAGAASPRRHHRRGASFPLPFSRALSLWAAPGGAGEQGGWGAEKCGCVCVCARGRAQAGLADARTSDALGQSSTARSEEPVKKWPGVSFGAVGLLSLFLPFLPFLPLAIARAASPAAQQAHSRERNRATECDRAPAVPTTACACLSAPGPGLLARH